MKISKWAIRNGITVNESLYDGKKVSKHKTELKAGVHIKMMYSNLVDVFFLCAPYGCILFLYSRYTPLKLNEIIPSHTHVSE